MVVFCPLILMFSYTVKTGDQKTLHFCRIIQTLTQILVQWGLCNGIGEFREIHLFYQLTVEKTADTNKNAEHWPILIYLKDVAFVATVKLQLSMADGPVPDDNSQVIAARRQACA